MEQSRSFAEAPVPRGKISGSWNPIAALVFAAVFIAGGAIGLRGLLADPVDTWLVGAGFGLGPLLAVFLSRSPRMADQWEKAIVLRLGRYQGARGPGLFIVIPLLDRVAMMIDGRIRTTTFFAEKTLTKDTVPVDVDAVLFWVVLDAKRAALAVEDYQMAVAWAAQTALREVIGKTELASLLAGRDLLDVELQRLIDKRTEPWGVQVQSVEIRDVVIPEDLQDAMSRQAQAERERQARIILGESERQIADSFVDAAAKYKRNPEAFQLRAMNMLFEGLKEKGALVVVPSTAVESMGLGTIAGLTSLHREEVGPDGTGSART
jgi:regulator of protease activity HflC (stomatin/prohibitin superfamily)